MISRSGTFNHNQEIFIPNWKLLKPQIEADPSFYGVFALLFYRDIKTINTSIKVLIITSHTNTIEDYPFITTNSQSIINQTF
jgi:hypothetical protein